MTTRILACAVCIVSLAAAESATPLDQLFDGKLTSAQRANACFDLRGKIDPDAIHAMSRALEDPDLLACAAENLRIAGAIQPLRRALSSENPQVRAAAARELGSFEKPELLESLSLAARDQNTLVATNAIAGLSRYRDPVVVPYLADLAKRGGMTGDMAIERLAQLDTASALAIARELMGSPQVPDKLYAMRIIGSFGNARDLPVLQKIAASEQENLTQHDRGFGLMPAINLSRAAKSAIASIEARH